MRKVLWLIIIALCMVPVAYIGMAYFYAPEKDAYQSYQSFVSIGKQYIDGRTIDQSVIVGTNEDDDYVRVQATYLAGLQNIHSQLGKEKGFLLTLISPKYLATPQATDVSLEKIADYDKKVVDIYAEYQRIVQERYTAMGTIDANALKVFKLPAEPNLAEKDVAEFKTTLEPYLGLSQYVKAIMEFVKSRDGYYTLSEDGKSLRFTNPEDQAYYDQLLQGVAQRSKIIEDANVTRIETARKAINSLD